ncbi:hypothetical protein K435DRAFT_855863 [Dendrothele bispora CBS 962.96]|uniref:Uncharacterized protein n=1 Tax=Dendrothele bispora (strain CBS 962.96) TaxID=1314807 RepID=A0A4S8KTJ3_DENBC|nr:hypothetical protein K435DRAFT_875792 [Dendrothele bispora CBS 962.96]THU99300.1 hypothetical protein K435DRAFT_855863 [Dendrothele bispora CBS 962.96]
MSSVFLGLLLQLSEFSGGRDTVSLRRASLKAETIQALMVVKAELRMARIAIIEILGDE